MFFKKRAKDQRSAATPVEQPIGNDDQPVPGAQWFGRGAESVGLAPGAAVTPDQLRSVLGTDRLDDLIDCGDAEAGGVTIRPIYFEEP